MLKLIIVDDETIIRETIQSFIDWSHIGIEVVGVCKDGIEAYNMILDEYPDIVLTDIKMPGLSGLELIERILQTDKNIEFVILSGYGDFDYAKTAMKYGVRHYLLKPCNESQIIEVMNTIKEDCYQRRAVQEEKLLLTHKLTKNLLKNLLFQSIIQQDPMDIIIKEYEKFIDFTNLDYELCYFYYLEEERFPEGLNLFRSYLKEHSVEVTLFSLYVKHTLVIFFQSFDTNYIEMDQYFNEIKIAGQLTSVEYKRESYFNLSDLLHVLMQRLKRYEVISFMEEGSNIPIYNHNALFQNMNDITNRLASGADFQSSEILSELKQLLNSTQDMELIKAFVTNLLLKLSSSLRLTGTSTNITDFFIIINECHKIETIRTLTLKKLEEVLSIPAIPHGKYKDFIEKIIQYIEEHLSNPNLSLKWIADNYLFMNVDYLSKQFFKQTGYKFSYYLTNVRMRKAQDLLLGSDQEKIYSIAEAVGCGNNPQYFSQIFKKHMGMTPTAYIKNNGGK